MRSLLTALFSLSLLIAACGGGGGQREPVDVAVTLDEWSVRPVPEEVRPGAVNFQVTNAGVRPHEFIVVKSDLPPGQLPLANEVVDISKVNVAGRLDPMSPSAVQTLSLTATPGKYVLICNLVETSPGAADPHYLNGMAAGFIVLDR
jgi:hypothetical protein